MKITILEKKIEAVKRMRLLRLYEPAIKEFERDNVVHYSEAYGILYWLSNNPEWLKIVNDFEKKHNALVYHAELSYLEFGTCLSFLYVSDHKSEWKRDTADLRQGYCFSYVKNLDDDYCSEFGTIAIKSLNGGIKRVG